MIKISDRLESVRVFTARYIHIRFEYLPGVQNEEALNRTKMETLSMLMGVYQIRKGEVKNKSRLE